MIHSSCADCSHVEDKKWIKNCKGLRALHPFILPDARAISHFFISSLMTSLTQNNIMAASRRSHTGLEGHPESCNAPFYSIKTGTFSRFFSQLLPKWSFQQWNLSWAPLLISSCWLYGPTASAMETFIPNLQPTSVFSLVCLMIAFFKVPSRWISPPVHLSVKQYLRIHLRSQTEPD